MNNIFRNIVLTLAFLFVFFTSFAQGANTLSSLKYDKVIIYEYFSGYNRDIVDGRGRVIKDAKKQAPLNTAEMNNLSKYLDSKSSYGNVEAGCFDPHFGIVYYDKTKIAAYMTVCFSCNRLRSSIELAGQKGKMGKGKDAYYMLDGGLSKTFRHFLSTLLIKYKFSEQITPGDPYDK